MELRRVLAPEYGTDVPPQEPPVGTPCGKGPKWPWTTTKTTARDLTVSELKREIQSTARRAAKTRFIEKVRVAKENFGGDTTSFIKTTLCLPQLIAICVG